MNKQPDISSESTLANRALSVLALLGICWLATYWSTLSAMAEIWMRSDTFAHGALIPILSGWLIWRKRSELHNNAVTPCWPILLPIVATTLVWLMAVAVDVMAIAQLAIMIQLPLIILMVMGWRWTSTIAFPLLYLLFSVPIGEELTLPLQQITADFTVTFLQLSGIPVYINGLYIEIPSGKFEVAEACSGIRYLIASLAIGTLYAYLSYSSLKKRLIFILASIVVPIVANGIRAYMIVMIAHLSEMKYATGVDHLIYGWVFFGVIMALMFWIGGFWHDPIPSMESEESHLQSDNHFPPPIKPILLASLSVFGVFIVSYAAVMQLEKTPDQPIAQTIKVELPLWHAVEQESLWSPKFNGADSTYQQVFRAKNGEEVELYIANYQYEGQGKELINSSNRLQRENYWTVADRHQSSIQIGSDSQPVNVLELRALDGTKRRILSWYNVLGRTETNKAKIKIIQAIGKLLGSGEGGTLYAIAVEYDDQEIAKENMQLFLNDNWNAITNSNVIIAKTP